MAHLDSALEPLELLVQLSDLHVHVGAGDAVAAERIERALGFVAQLDPQPAAVVLTGDLVNTGTAAEYERLAQLLAPLLELGAAILPIAGNHDDRALLRATLGGAANVVALGDERHLQYVHDIAGGPRVIALDTQHTGLDSGKLCSTRLAWLEATLAAAPDVSTVLAMHHPPVAIGIPPLDAIGIRARDLVELEQIVAGAPQVELIVAGHVHRASTGSFARVPVFTCPSVYHATRVSYRADVPLAMAQSPVGLGVHALLPGGAIASHTRVLGPTPGTLTIIPPV